MRLQPITTKPLDRANADDVREVLQARIIELEDERKKLVSALRTAISLQHLPQGREALEHARSLLRELGEVA